MAVQRHDSARLNNQAPGAQLPTIDADFGAEVDIADNGVGHTLGHGRRIGERIGARRAALPGHRGGGESTSGRNGNRRGRKLDLEIEHYGLLQVVNPARCERPDCRIRGISSPVRHRLRSRPFATPHQNGRAGRRAEIASPHEVHARNAFHQRGAGPHPRRTLK